MLPPEAHAGGVVKHVARAILLAVEEDLVKHCSQHGWYCETTIILDGVEAVARGVDLDWLVVLAPGSPTEGLAMAGSLLQGRAVDQDKNDENELWKQSRTLLKNFSQWSMTSYFHFIIIIIKDFYKSV